MSRMMEREDFVRQGGSYAEKARLRAEWDAEAARHRAERRAEELVDHIEQQLERVELATYVETLERVTYQLTALTSAAQDELRKEER